MYQITLTTYGQSLISSTVIIDGLVLLYDYIENISSVTSISSYTQQLDEEACGNLKGIVGNIRIQDNSNNMYQARTLLLYKLVNNEKKIIGGYSQEEAIIQKGNQNLNLFLSLDMSAFTNGFLFSSIQAGFPTASHNTDGLVHIEDPNVDSDNTYSVYNKAQVDTLLTTYIQKITPSTDNAIIRFDGVNGAIQTSTATIIDDGSVVLAGGNDTSSSNAKLILWKTWLGSNSGSSVVIGTINNSNYDTTYSLDTTTFRPATSKKDNIDLGTNTVGWKDLYLAGKLYKRTGTNTTYALTLPSKAGTLALLSDMAPGDTLVAGNNITLTRDSSLPDGYTRVSYISSKGSSYLNTGINPTDKTKIVIDIFVNNTNALYATGSRLNGSADINLALFGRSSGSTILGVFNTKEISAKTGSTDWQRTASGQRLSAVLETNNGNYSFSVEDKTNNRSYSDTGTYTLIGTSTVPIYLFALNTTNIQSNDSQVYQYQIYQNDVLVANYIPCFRNSDTIYGFYDTVSSTFKVSASTGFSGGQIARDTVTISATIPSNYVTTDTTQTITGNKTFNSSNVTLGGNTDLILTYFDSTTSSVSTTTRSASTIGGDTVNIPDLNINLGAGTEYGEGVITGLSSSKHRLNIGYINDAIAHFGDSGLVMENNRGLYTYKLGNDQNYVQLAYVNYIYANRVGSSTNYVSHVYATTINASSFIKDGGTSSQFLKADGSVDSNTYALSTDVPTVNNAILTIKKNNSDTGSTFTANASTDVTVNLGLKEGAFLDVDENTTTASSTNLTTGKSMAAYVTSQLPTVNNTTITIKKNSEDTGDSFTTNASSAKTINLGLSDVASSGSYNDLDDKPDIPTVNNATLTIKKNNSDTGSTFTANASSDVTVNLGLKEGAFVDVDETTMTASSTNLPTAKAVASYISGLGYLTTETDPTVPSWAKAENKPNYTLDEVSDGTTRKLSNYVPTSRTINSKALTSNITLTLDDVADGTSRVIPTVNNATLTINKGGTDDTGSKTFSANASSNVTINLGLSTVASSGDYNDLDNLPTIPTVNNAKLTIKKNNYDTGTAFTANASTDVTCNLGLATVATSGSYSDLSDKPEINDSTITIKKNSDDSGSSFTTNIDENVTINLGLATVATSGSYSDLSNKPNINNATLTINKGGTDDTGSKTFSANASSNVTINLGLATVASSGSYSDLSNKPSIPTSLSDLDFDDDIIPETDSSYDLGNEDYKLDDVWANTFHGDLSGNATTATTATNLASAPSLSFTAASSNSTDATLTVTSGGLTSTAETISTVKQAYKPYVNTYSGNAEYSVCFSSSSSAGFNDLAIDSDSKLKYNPSTNTLYSTTFSGALSGNATSATNAQGLSKTNSSTTYTISLDTTNNYWESNTAIKTNGLIGPYATCSTARGTQKKEITLTGFKLVTGARVLIKFTNSNSASNPTLSINGETAKAIKRFGTASVDTTSYRSWSSGSIIELVYDGTNWIWNGYQEYAYYSQISDTTFKVEDENGENKYIYSGYRNSRIEEYEEEEEDPTFFWTNTSFLPDEDNSFNLGDQYRRWSSVYANTIHTSSQVGPFIQCDTAAATAVKEVIIPNFTLKTGSRLLVKFTNAHNSSTAPLLKIKSSADDTDAVAYSIKLATSYFSTSETVYNWLAGEIIELVFWIDTSTNPPTKYWFRVGWQYGTPYSSTSNYCYYPYVQGNSNNSNYPIPFLSSISSSSSNQSKTIYTDTENSIYYNPSTNTLTTSKLSLGTVNSAASTTYSTLLQTYNSDTTNYKNGIQCTGNFLPSVTNTYDLGNSSLKWNKIYLNGISNGTNNYSLPSNNGTLALDNIYVSIGTKSRDYVNSSYDYRQEGSGHNKPRFKSSDISIAINEYLVFSNGTRIAVYVPSRIYVGSIGFKISASSAYYSAYPVCFRGTSSEHNPTVPAGTVLNLVFYNNAFYADFYDLADFGKEHEPIVSVGTLSTHNDSEFGGALVGICSDDGTVDKVITVTKSGGVPTTSTYNNNILDTSPVYVCFWGECYSAHPRVPFGFILSREDYDDAGVTPTDSNIPFIWVRPSSDTSTVASHYAQNPENDIYYFHIPNAPVYVLTESYNNRCVSIGGLPSGYKGRLIGFLQPSIKDSTTGQAVDAGLLRLVNTNSNYVDNAKYAEALVYQGSTKLQPNSTYITSYDDILPYNNNAYDLGSTSNRWRNIYVNGSNSSYYLRIGNSGDSSWTYPTIRPGTTGIGLLGIPDYKWHALFCNYIGSDPEPVTQAFISTVYGNLSGNADTASQVYVNAVSNNYNYPLVFRSSATAGSSVSSVNNSLYTDSVNSCYYNPSTNTLTCPKFSGTPIIPQGTATLSSSTWTVSSPTPNPTTSEDPPTGAIVCVYFGSTNSVSQPTLKFGSWNAKSIYRTSSGYAGTGAAMSWDAGSYVLLRYSGSVWYILNYNTNPTSTASGTTNVIPSADNAYNLGSSSYKWKEGFFTGGASSTYLRFSVDGEATIEPNATQCCKVGTSSKRFWYGYFYNLYASSLYIGDISLSSYITNLLKGTASCAFYVFKVTFNNTSGSQKTLSRGQNLGSLPSGVTITAYQERMDDTGSAGTSYSTTLSGTYYTCMEIILGTGSSNVYVPCVRG